MLIDGSAGHRGKREVLSMIRRSVIPAFLALFLLGGALLLFGCVRRGGAQSKQQTAPAATPTPAVLSIGAAEDGTDALPAPTAPTTPIPVGKVEYRADADAHYEILADKTISVTGGLVEIIVDGLAFSSAVQTSDGGSVRLALTNGASMSGQLIGESMLDFSVTLDAASSWTLKGDVRVDALVNADATFGNVTGNGYTLSYNCENAENAYLDRAALSLLGGGQLSPVI